MLKKDELEHIRQAFKLTDKLKVIKSLSSGDVNTAYLVSSGATKYVLKKINKEKYVKDYDVKIEKLIQSLVFSEKIAAQLSNTNHVTSAYFSGSDCIAETESHLILLYPNLDAVILENHSVSTSHVKDIASFLQTLHQTQLNFDHEFAEEKFKIFKEIGTKILDHDLWCKISTYTHKTYFFPKLNVISNYLLTHKDDFMKAIDSIEGRALCHNDLKPKNVLWKNNHFWVVDWETAGLFDQTSDYLDSLLAWCTIYEKQQISIDENKLRAFMETYPLPDKNNLENHINVVLIKWYFWLAFCINKLIKDPKKFSNYLWHIRYAINFIIFLINGNIISEIKKY